MDTVTKRLIKEIKNIQNSPNEQIPELHPISDDDLLEWKAVILGQEDSYYKGGRFELAISVPKTYPIQPPKIRFVTKICHPNVHFKTGEICLDLLKTEWSPAWTLQSACMAICVLLTQPEPSSPLNCDAANLLRCGDELGYKSLIQMYVNMYAKQQ
ncbi:ubiquitin-conjugating enzyme [Piromyces finnis]|uniref:Ubiquitin-conjugating enzyme n=1 Tax=Piromyces finnis TaxID=1754191 RepID=A0A1Y1V9C8_9FUNG|nr:ubiquitin-conjugating enzyme [Piromyces finnis]|eukprot:ORX50351.1 ubiquitin-conjugating enzyme [Piromyces finnis]